MIGQILDKVAVDRIRNSNSARDLLIHSFNDFNIEQLKYGYNSLVESIGNALPDMMWAKDVEGRYLWANQKIIDSLLFSGTLDNTLGRTDFDMASKRRKIIGPENHTFGVVCGNSDIEVLRDEVPMRFLEFGLVTGKPMYLEVHKNVFRDKNGIVIGTVGTGRDITEEYLAYQDIQRKLKSGSVNISDIADDIKKIMDKFYFEV